MINFKTLTADMPYSFPLLPLLYYLIPTLLSFTYLTWLLYTLTLHPLAPYPGPFLAGLTRLWYVQQIYRGSSDRTMRRLHALHGAIVRIAPDEFSLSDPAAIAKIYDARGTFAKTDLYDVWDGKTSKRKNLFSGRDEAVHAPRRRIVNGVYSMTNVLESERYVDQVTTAFMAQLGKFAAAAAQGGVVGGGGDFDLCKWLERYTADVVGELMFGRPLGALAQSPAVQGYLSSRNALLQLVSTMSVAPSYGRPFFIPLALLSSTLRLGFTAFRDLLKWAKDVVAERKQGASSGHARGRVDMMDKLYRIVEEKGEVLDFGPKDVAVEVAAALQAGTDTTSITMVAVLYYLMKNPPALQKLHAEIDDAAAAIEASTLSSPHIKYSDAIKLPYLSACIKESMRLHPPLGTSMPRHIPSGGAELAGAFFPEGVKVGVNAAVVQYDKDVFGDDAEFFRPERWLVTHDKAQLAQMERTMLVFGAGKRTCIGMHISMCQIQKLIPTILRTFEMELVDPSKEWKTSNWWFNKQSGVQVRVRRRPAAGLEAGA